MYPVFNLGKLTITFNTKIYVTNAVMVSFVLELARISSG